MPLKLIHGPLNSGRRGLILRDFAAALDRDPVLVVPNVDDVFEFEREICAAGAALGGSVTTFGGLFREIAAAGDSPPGAELSPAQRRRAVAVGIAEHRRELGPLRKSALRPGFAVAFERLLDELQAAGLDPAQLGAGAETLESSAYLGDLGTLAAGYAQVRDRLARTDSHQIAREAISLLRRSGELWSGRPLFLYGIDDLTHNQLELVETLAAIAEVTVALTYEEDREALAARAGLLEKLRDRIGFAGQIATEPGPENTPSQLLFHLERGFGAIETEPRAPDGGLRLLRSAGARGEAEAIGIEVAKLIAAGTDPAEIVVVARDPARRGPLLASVLESYGVATALEAELPVKGTGVGGCLIALLETEFGAGRATDLLRFLRGPSGVPSQAVDWFERALRRGRAQSAAAALELWQREDRDLPRDLAQIRAAAGSPEELSATVGRLAATMASRPLRRRGDGARPEPGEGTELRAAAEIANALAELAELGDLAPGPSELAATIEGLDFRAWSGPVGSRVRIADPYRLRAGRFDHVFIASLQDGEFPRRDRGGDPFLAERQRAVLGLDPRRDTEAEERYLFYACLSLAGKTLTLSYRDSDENGVAETRSPLLDDVRRLLSPPPPAQGDDPVEAAISRTRDLAQIIHPVAEAPSEDGLARAIAAHGRNADAAALGAVAGVDSEVAASLVARLGTAATAEAAARAPGPLANPAAIESLASVGAYGGTTLEEFDLCSYRWFAGHELDPQLLDPAPDPLVQGGVMHAALERLYVERPGGDPLPRPASLPLWTARGLELVTEICVERELGEHPAERAIARRVQRLLVRFLAEESRRETGGFEPWLLEATFGEHEDSDRPVLDLGGWGLHGAIDRVDRAADGSALVLDYKLSGSVTPREKFEEKAKLQLQLYLLAVAEHWGANPIGGLYHPLRGTSVRRPRGAVLDEAATELASYRLYDKDVVGEEGLEELLEEAQRRAGEIVARMRSGEIRRNPGPRPGLRGHDICPTFCQFAPICRRDRAPVEPAGDEEEDER
ncbi:MAG TPA: PD-(D/E)XK nuclease family protein [Solirubrobacterales bacterium]|nr:PD-(D/E)XK nuclease family protein [Solirubrobacterales bacterium]